MNNEYRLLPVALAPHIKDAIVASGHFMPESLWAAIIAAHDLVAPRKAALQELADIAQEYNMGYGSAATERSATLADEITDGQAEHAYWQFDARRKGYAEWRGVPQSERDAFKAEYRAAISAIASHAPAASSSAAPSDVEYQGDLDVEELACIKKGMDRLAAPAAPSVPDAWMKALSTETTSQVHKTWMENAGFGVWKEAAAQYTRPLYFAAPAASPAVLTDAEMIALVEEYSSGQSMQANYIFRRARILALLRHITGQAGGEVTA